MNSDLFRRTVVQTLFTGSGAMSVDALRAALRDCFREDGNPEVREIAALDRFAFVNELLKANSQLQKVGLQLRVADGMVELVTARVEHMRVHEMLRNKRPAAPPVRLGPRLEVLSAVIYKQPVRIEQINQIFGRDVGYVVRDLRESRLVHAHTRGGALFLTTGQEVLDRMGVGSLDELRSMLEAERSPEQIARLTEAMDGAIAGPGSAGLDAL